MNTQLLIQILQFALGVAVLIILHEFGHYIASRLVGVEVEEFGIGFPPRVAKLFEAGGTEFTLNAIPLGGFVRPKGENDPEVPGGLAAASPWKRLLVLVAGPFMNLLVAVILGILFIYSLGQPVLEQVRIEAVMPGSPAETAGLQAGDLIAAISGVSIDALGSDVDRLEKVSELIGQAQGQPIDLTYRRGEQTTTVNLTPRYPPPDDGAIGIQMGHPREPIGLVQAIPAGFGLAYENAKAIVLLPARLLSGSAAPEEGRLVGFKGMFDIYQQISNAAYFFMAISVSLGVLNLFPLPALDGGRILFTLPEILLRKRIPAQYENAIHLIGFALLLMLIIYINLQDFINPLVLP